MLKLLVGANIGRINTFVATLYETVVLKLFNINKSIFIKNAYLRHCIHATHGQYSDNAHDFHHLDGVLIHLHVRLKTDRF